MIKIALFQPDIAGNVGTIMRSCACLDIELHIIEPCGFVFDMQKIKRAALDYINNVRLYRYNSFDEFHQKQIKEKPENRLVLLTTKTDISYTDFKFCKNDILLLGRESAGIPEEIANLIECKVKIIMKNNMRSLNVAISCAMVAGEAIRQNNP